MKQRSANYASWVFLGGMLLGMLTIVIGASWSLMISPAQVWSTEDALEYQAANDALHEGRTKNRSSSGNGEMSPELAAAKARFDRIDAQLESARSAYDAWGHWIAAVGAGVILLCGAGFLVLRRAAE